MCIIRIAIEDVHRYQTIPHVSWEYICLCAMSVGVLPGILRGCGRFSLPNGFPEQFSQSNKINRSLTRRKKREKMIKKSSNIPMKSELNREFSAIRCLQLLTLFGLLEVVNPLPVLPYTGCVNVAFHLVDSLFICPYVEVSMHSYFILTSKHLL